MASKPPGNREAVQGRRAWSLAGCLFSLTASTLAFVLPGEAIPARANLRLLLDVQISAGKQHTSLRAKAALARLLDELDDRRPALVRGDSGYGNEGILVELERRQQPYLLRLRQTENGQTENVQRLGAQQVAQDDWTRADSQGCQMVEVQLQLHG